MTDIKELEKELRGDVSAQRIAAVYAQALHGAAGAAQADEVYEELQALVRDVFPRQPDLERVFGSGAISRHHKEALIRKAFTGRASELFTNFLLVLNRHERLELVRVIMKAYRELRDKVAKRVRVHITSAVSLPDEQRDRIAADIRRITELEPIVEQQVDPALLGGVVIRVEDYLYDGSLRTRLAHIQKHLIERCSHEIQSGRDRFRNRE